MGGCSGGQFWDPIDGGSCYSCPEGFERSWSPVKASDACVTASNMISFARGYCAYSQALFRDSAEAGLCVAKLIGENSLSRLSQIGASNAQPWNSLCSYGAEIGTTIAIDLAIDAAINVASGGSAAGATSAKTAAKTSNNFKKFMDAVRKVGQAAHDAAGHYSTFESTAEGLSSCDALKQGSEG